MRILIKVLLIALIFISSLNIEALSSEVNVSAHSVAIISTSQHETSLNSSKNNEGFIVSNQRNNTQLNIIRRNTNDNTNAQNEQTIPFNTQQINLIKHIYFQSYFDKEPELALLPLLYQIQPNAP